MYPGTESVSFLGSKIWDMEQNELRSISNLAAFKKGIKKWSLDKCPCRLCKFQIITFGFVWKKDLDGEYFPLKIS